MEDKDMVHIDITVDIDATSKAMVSLVEAIQGLTTKKNLLDDAWKNIEFSLKSPKQ